MNPASSIAPSLYWKVWLTLLLLLGLTCLVAQVDLGRFNIIAATTIASTKATLVVLYFMHLRYRARLTWLFAAAGFFWLAILLGLTISDYVTRGMNL